MQWGANVNEKKGSKPIQPFTGTLTYNSNVNMLRKPTQSDDQDYIKNIFRGTSLQIFPIIVI